MLKFIVSSCRISEWQAKPWSSEASVYKKWSWRHVMYLLSENAMIML